MNKELKRIIIVLVGICILFVSLIVYLSYFQVFKAEIVKKIAIINDCGSMRKKY